MVKHKGFIRKSFVRFSLFAISNLSLASASLFALLATDYDSIHPCHHFQEHCEFYVIPTLAAV